MNDFLEKPYQELIAMLWTKCLCHEMLWSECLYIPPPICMLMILEGGKVGPLEDN